MNSLSNAIPVRELGRTGFRASVLGIGDLADRNLPLATCVATLRRAIHAGLNVVDTAPGYEEGYSEQIVAEAVRGVREQLFIIDKIDDLDAPVAAQIDDSLHRLQLDHTDAFVFHALSSLATFERLASPGGGFDQLADCIEAGKTRFRGISSSSRDHREHGEGLRGSAGELGRSQEIRLCILVALEGQQEFPPIEPCDPVVRSACECRGELRQRLVEPAGVNQHHALERIQDRRRWVDRKGLIDSGAGLLMPT